MIDRKLYFREYHRKRSRKNKYYLERYKRFCGCKICGFKKYISALIFHHLDPSVKDDNVANFSYRSRKAIKSEIRKCVVLCCNCHQALHAGEIKI